MHHNCRNARFAEDLHRLARFGAEIADSFGCYILLPEQILMKSARASASNPLAVSEASVDEVSLILAAFHSMSGDVMPYARISGDAGLITWVAKHGRAIHVSPFDRDSRSLGIYSLDQQLKSFIGIPMALEIDAPAGQAGEQAIGVIACDSKKPFAFSKLHGRLIENLAKEVANTVRLSLFGAAAGQTLGQWSTFISRAEALLQSLGRSSVDLMRIRFNNFTELETALGTATATALTDQVQRLIEQTPPPHCPTFTLANGDILLVADNMLSGFLRNKIEAIAGHCTAMQRTNVTGRHKAAADDLKLQLGFQICSLGGKRLRAASLEEAIRSSAVDDNESPAPALAYAFKSA